MELLDEIGFKEKQVSRLSSLLKKYRDERIPEVRKKQPSEKPKQLSLPFCG